ncbi:MAG TPA: hypothetical protein VJK05_05365 [archaeon]|nr:hypothetical protein [archaeon]
MALKAERHLAGLMKAFKGEKMQVIRAGGMKLSPKFLVKIIAEKIQVGKRISIPGKYRTEKPKSMEVDLFLPPISLDFHHPPKKYKGLIIFTDGPIVHGRPDLAGEHLERLPKRADLIEAARDFRGGKTSFDKFKERVSEIYSNPDFPLSLREGYLPQLLEQLDSFVSGRRIEEIGVGSLAGIFDWHGLDNESVARSMENDKRNQQFLESHGFKVVRIWTDSIPGFSSNVSTEQRHNFYNTLSSVFEAHIRRSFGI